MAQIASRSILVIENDPPTTRQIRACLAQAGLKVLPPAITIREGLLLVSESSPDAIVMDMDLVADAHSRAGIVDRAAERSIPIVYLSSVSDLATLERAAASNAAGYVVKPFTDRQLVAAVLLATITVARAAITADGRRTLEHKLRAIAAVVNDLPDDGTDASRSGFRGEPATGRRSAGLLSEREHQIVQLLANGARVVTIAQMLELSPHTVRNHLKSVFRKLHVRGQHELFEYWRAQRGA